MSRIQASSYRTLKTSPSPTIKFATADLVTNWQRFAKLISHELPFADVLEAYKLATTPVPQTKLSSPSTTEPGDQWRIFNPTTPPTMSSSNTIFAHEIDSSPVVIA